jgi:hypothetical protein
MIDPFTTATILLKTVSAPAMPALRKSTHARMEQAQKARKVLCLGDNTHSQIMVEGIDMCCRFSWLRLFHNRQQQRIISLRFV